MCEIKYSEIEYIETSAKTGHNIDEVSFCYSQSYLRMYLHGQHA